MSSRSKTAVHRVLAVASLAILLPATLPAAGIRSETNASEESLWSRPLEPLWNLALSATCAATGLCAPHSVLEVAPVNVPPAPTVAGGCDKGILIDPNGGGCAQ